MVGKGKKPAESDMSDWASPVGVPVSGPDESTENSRQISNGNGRTGPTLLFDDDSETFGPQPAGGGKEGLDDEAVCVCARLCGKSCVCASVYAHVCARAVHESG